MKKELIVILTLLLAVPVLADLNVSFDMESDINKQTLYITIVDEIGDLKTLDFDAIINETSFNADLIKNSKIYIEKPYEYEKPIKELECKTDKVVNISGSFDVETCQMIETGTELIKTKIYEEKYKIDIDKTKKDLKTTWSKIEFDENHTIKLKLMFDTPVIKSAGWGSSGTVYLNTDYGIFFDKTHSSWWNSSFMSRYEVNVSNTDTHAVYNYTLNVTIDTEALIANGYLNANCSDFRTLTINNVSLNHYVENCGNATAVLWVAFNPLPVGNTTFYIYFNNSIAPDVSTWDTWLPFMARYSFNSTIGNIAYDSSPSAFHGTVQNSIQIEPGKFGNAYIFYSANSQYVNTSHQIPVLAAVYGMFDLWIKPASIGTVFMYDTDAGADTNSNFESGKIRHRTDGATTTDALTGDLSLSVGTWYHIQNTWNGTHKNVYINGILNVSQAVAHGAATNNNGAKFAIGSITTGGNYINFTVDEFRVYKNTAWIENATHTLIVPDTAISYVISDLQSTFNASVPGNATATANYTVVYYVYKNCTDENTLRTATNITNCTDSCSSSYIEYNEICAYGCDSVSNECNPNEFYQSLIFFGIVAFFILGYWLILFFDRQQQDISYLVAFILMIMSFLIILNLPDYFNSTIVLLLYFFPISYLLAGLLLAFKK